MPAFDHPGCRGTGQTSRAFHFISFPCGSRQAGWPGRQSRVSGDPERRGVPSPLFACECAARRLHAGGDGVGAGPNTDALIDPAGDEGTRNVML